MNANPNNIKIIKLNVDPIWNTSLFRYGYCNVDSVFWEIFCTLVSEVLSSISNSPKQIFFGINDRYSDGGHYNFLKDKFNLKSDEISKNIISTLGEI